MRTDGIRLRLGPAGAGGMASPRPPLVTGRKVALIGAASTVQYAPWDDPSWDVWAHTSAKSFCRRVDRYFDLHPKAIWSQAKPWDKHYPAWLASLTTPILMQAVDAGVPASVRYPKERILAEFRPYFTSQAAWMMALALIEGATTIGFFGVHYAGGGERISQRANCEYWMGLCEARGVRLVIPPGCPLLQEPKALYGYESHDSGRLADEYKPPKPTLPNGMGLTILGDGPPPPLRDLGEPVAWERSGHPVPQ